MEAVLRVFFSAKAADGKTSFDPDAPDCEKLRSLWTQTHSSRQSRRKPVTPIPVNRPEDWWLEGGFEFPDLVTFRTFQPVPVETGIEHYEVPVSLVFGAASPEDGDVQINLALTAAWLEIPVTSFQPSPDGMIGDPARPNDNIEKQLNGRYKIVGPAPNGVLEGETIGADDRFARVEPASRRGGPLAPRITAAMTDLNFSAVTLQTRAPAGVDRDLVLKVLLGKGCRRDEATGRIILAERLLTRKASRT
jgi:hypothetical protein